MYCWVVLLIQKLYVTGTTCSGSFYNVFFASSTLKDMSSQHSFFIKTKKQRQTQENKRLVNKEQDKTSLIW